MLQPMDFLFFKVYNLCYNYYYRVKIIMMASGFYSTGDGHVGNLGKKTLPELKDLLARQQKILQKK